MADLLKLCQQAPLPYYVALAFQYMALGHVEGCRPRSGTPGFDFAKHEGAAGMVAGLSYGVTRADAVLRQLGNIGRDPHWCC